MKELELLAQFNLTSNEASIYYALLTKGSLNGYQIAKITGISRSNTYISLASLVDKGCANKIDGESTLYSPLSIEEFCSNRIRNLENTKKELISLIPISSAKEHEYITVTGAEHIRNKIRNMIASTQKRIYMSLPHKVFNNFEQDLVKLADNNIKVVLITDSEKEAKGIRLHVSDEPIKQVRIICDSQRVLTGDFDGPSCLYSEKENLVKLLKDSIKNEMTLIELKKNKSL